MKEPSHGPEPCASANSAMPAWHLINLLQIQAYVKCSNRIILNIYKENILQIRQNMIR